MTDDGERLATVGTGLLTAKLTEFEAPPPGEGFVTTTANAPAVVWSPAVSEIVNCVELMKVALWAALLYVTVELERKFVPLMVSVSAAAPAVAEDGERLVMLGTGLDGGGTELPPPPPQAVIKMVTART
jgi:hypothetical protein